MKKTSIIGLALAVVLVLGSVYATATARGEEMSFGPARAALLIDSKSGTVIYEKNADERRQIASMVKLMTLNIVFEEMNAGNISVDEDITVSEYAAGMGGSQAFLDAHSTYNAGELLKSIIIASANDSCVAMAEHISGDVGAFVQRMNDKASEWGMKDTYFVNCTGLPAPNQYSTARDASVMLSRLINNESFFEYAKIWMLDFHHPSGRVTSLTNTNKLVRFYNGCDGGKTGFTSEAKSCLAATAKRGDTRLICVVMGAEDSKARNAEVSKLFDYGFAGYESKLFARAGEAVDDEISVNGGKTSVTYGYIAGDLSAFVKKGQSSSYTVEKSYYKLNAPVHKGSIIGELKLLKDGNVVDRTNILSKLNVEREDYFDIIDNITQKW